MKKRTITDLDLPEITKKVTQKEILYTFLLKEGKKTFTQIVDATHIKSHGHVHTMLKQLIYEKRLKKVICKCCGITEQYEVIP